MVTAQLPMDLVSLQSTSSSLKGAADVALSSPLLVSSNLGASFENIRAIFAASLRFGVPVCTANPIAWDWNPKLLLQRVV
jgi:hypothetical protein